MNIDVVNYHNNDILKSEYAQARKELDELFLDTKFEKTITSLFDKYYASLNAKERIRFLCRVYVATSKDIKDPILLKNMMIKMLPIHLYNLKILSAKRLFILEINNACTFNCASYLQSRLSLKTDYKDENEKYIFLLIDSLLKSLTSTFTLFEMGDDVHAFSLMRGFLEQEIKLCVLLQNNLLIDRFIEFSRYNALRRHGKENQAMKNLFFNARVRSDSEKEAYLLYGWADENSKVMSFRRLLEIYNESDAPKIYALYGAMSEFVHEDYLGVNYDYIKMRKKFSDYLTLIFFKFLYPLIQNYIGRDILILNGVKIKDIVNVNMIKNEMKSFVPTIKFM